MPAEIALAASVSFREAGFDESCLQRRIFENPACLGLGDLIALDKERRQGSGGRLDILLKDPEDDTMFEVEVMLGETDETHIIRTIEYWDNEKRRWPQRQHYAVLVAEHINRRFFNVIHLLSHSVPIIAIQAALLEAGGQRFLWFSKVLDTFEEIDDGTSIETQECNRDYWSASASWTLAAADALLAIARRVDANATLSYVRSYIAIGSRKNYVWIKRRSGRKTQVGFRIAESQNGKAQELFDAANLVPNQRRGAFNVVLDNDFIRDSEAILQQIIEVAKDA
ncbi:MAG: hypothetical protein HQL41_17380 [Alphaproteobacteria bacterium]|nr:hypothetical protein [Alphaproteobacteria bacterium]